MSAMASQITSLTTVSSTICSGTDQRKHQSSASLAFVRGIQRGPVNSPHERPVFPFDDVIMYSVPRPVAAVMMRTMLTMINVIQSSTGKDFNYLYHLNADRWYKVKLKFCASPHKFHVTWVKYQGNYTGWHPSQAMRNITIMRTHQFRSWKGCRDPEIDGNNIGGKPMPHGTCNGRVGLSSTLFIFQI